MCFRHLGKSVRLKAYLCTVRCIKCSWVFRGFLFMIFFVLKRSLWMLYIGPFPTAETTYKLLWNSRNVRNLKKNFMIPFYGWGLTASRLGPLRGGNLLFTTKSPEISGTHFIDLWRMKGWVDLGATQWFWTQDPWIGNPVP